MRRPAVFRLAAVALGAASLAGCVATKTQTIPYDNARPAELADLAACRAKAPRPGESCVALVRASDWHTRTNLAMDAGQAWCIEVPPGQRWFDASRASSPLDGEPGSAAMNTAADWKRVKGAPWFALVAGVVTPAGQEVHAELVRDMPAEGRCAHRLEPRAPGTLVFYPNDAAPPAGRKTYFYGNNAGQVWLKLTRLR